MEVLESWSVHLTLDDLLRVIVADPDSFPSATASSAQSSTSWELASACASMY
jgi:hypothetical protein